MLSNPVKYTDPSGESAVEYACEVVHSHANGIAAGTNTGIGVLAVLTAVNVHLFNLVGEADLAAQALADGAAASLRLQKIANASSLAALACGGVKAKALKCGAKKPNSFGGDTVVMTRDGPKPIADVQVGDEVAAYERGSLQAISTDAPDTSWRRVIGKSSRASDSAMKLTVHDSKYKQETITVTGGHPYLRPASDINGKGILDLVKLEPFGEWTSVQNLKPGDELVSALGGKLVVDSVELSKIPLRVYDLEVDGLHSFAVGGLAALAHNAGGGTPGNNQAQNKQFGDACRVIERCIGRKLNKKDRRKLHDEITGQDLGFDDIVQCGQELFGGGSK